MFAYLGNTINIPAPVTLVATPLPNSIALRAPYDNVSPSVSSAQLDNNASGNNVLLSKRDNAQISIPINIAAEKFSVPANSNSASFTANAQTAFLTQLASGDISPEIYGIFAQYEKLLSYANVKYKPSNAGKPVDPVSLFSTLLELEKGHSVHSLQFDTEVSLPEDAVLPENITERVLIPVEIEPIQTQELQLVKEATLLQLHAYNASSITHELNTPAPHDLESA